MTAQFCFLALSLLYIVLYTVKQKNFKIPLFNVHNNIMDVLFQFIETYSRYKLPDSINKIGYSKSRGLSKCQEYLFWRQRCVFKINAANTKVIYAVYITPQTIHSKLNAQQESATPKLNTSH